MPSVEEQWIAGLDEVTGPEHVGGKGHHLSRLTAAGLPVPPGFSVTARGLDALARGEPRCVEAVRAALSHLGAAAVAVRSSAIGEDGASASFAGIHLTKLHVHSVEAVLAALVEVRASASTPAARSYRERRGVRGDPRMAAVVQAMVIPRCSGVLFTQDPATRADRTIIEASWGLGDAVVSGLVTPDRYILSREGRVISTTAGDKEAEIVPAEEGTMEIAVEGPRRHTLCLGPDGLAELHRVAMTCERLFGAPQDIEWAISDSALHVLQCRPIT
jgi:pyruvate, water dikinase